jgi:regulation of enolase protein 1 (concanavalin A-like superfamily)
LLADHPFADMIAKRGHDLVHDRFCVELMVNSIEAIYDQAGLKMRASEGVPR